MSAPRGLLFLCVANSARSQIAEGWAKQLFADLPGLRIQSAGSRPTRVNPFALEVMREAGVELADQASKSVSSIDPATVDTVITLCAEEECPVFLGPARRLHWPLADPAPTGVEASADETRRRFRATREEVRARLVAWRAAGFP